MKVFAQFLLSFWLAQFLYAQATVEEVTINAEFYGQFNRSQVEIVFYNSTKRDNIEGSCLIQTNRSAVVYDLSVEMDNTLRHAETFSRATGESIYHNVVTQRKDPALLTKTGPGAFYLSVFPVRKKERLRAVIRFISVLEDNEQGSSSFSFYSLPNSPKNLTVRALVPPGTAIAFSGRELAVPDGSSEPNDGFEYLERDLTYQINDDIEVRFDFSKIVVVPRYYDDKLQLFQYAQCDQIDFMRSYKSWKHYVPEFLYPLIVSVKAGNQIHWLTRKSELKRGFSADLFLERFITYLEKLTIFEEVVYHPDTWRWFAEKEQWYYMDDNLKLSRQEPAAMDSVRVIDIECPFLGTFFEYNDNLEFTNYNRYWQKRKGFLTSRTAKVVLGDDEETRRVRKRAIEAENQNVFAQWDEPPTPIGGLRRIQEKLVYPEFAIRRKIEGIVVVACLVDEEGKVRDTKILKSLHPILDLITMQAIKSVKWKPATSWSGPIATRISIPVHYKLENFAGQRLDMTFPWPYQVFQKEFVIHEVKENYLFYEEGFETESATRIQYLSDDFFALLVEHPDLIEYPYYLFNQGNIAGGIGLTVDAKNFEFVHMEINHEKKEEP